MFKCGLCDKYFEYRSFLEKHMNKKNPCNKPKESTECNLCHMKFPCLAKLKKHEESKKHINNSTNITNNINIINNIYNFPAGTKAFSETNLDAIGISDITYPLKYDNKLISIIKDFKDGEIYPSNEAYVTFFKYFIKVFKKLNFNLAFTENNNCLIFSFSKNHNDIVEYYVLEIDNEINLYKTKKIEYKLFMKEFINLLKRVDNEFNCPDFKYILYYILKYKNRYDDDEYIKENVEKELLKEYNIFNSIKDEKALEDAELSRARILFLKKNFGHINR